MIAFGVKEVSRSMDLKLANTCFLFPLFHSLIFFFIFIQLFYFSLKRPTQSLHIRLASFPSVLFIPTSSFTVHFLTCPSLSYKFWLMWMNETQSVKSWLGESFLPLLSVCDCLLLFACWQRQLRRKEDIEAMKKIDPFFVGFFSHFVCLWLVKLSFWPHQGLSV